MRDYIMVRACVSRTVINMARYMRVNRIVRNCVVLLIVIDIAMRDRRNVFM